MRVSTDWPFRQIIVSGCAAAGLTALGLGVDVARSRSGGDWFGPASLMAALVAWGLMLALQVRLRSVVLHDDEGYAALFDDALADTRESGARYRQIVETAKEGILTLDTDMAISAVNQRAADMLGYSMDELVGHRVSEFSGDSGAGSGIAGGVHPTGGGLTGERETTLRRKDGTIVSVLLNESPLLDREGRYAGQLGMITDLTEQKWFEDELAFRALHDPLTGLPNRLLLADRLQLALGQGQAGPGRRRGVDRRRRFQEREHCSRRRRRRPTADRDRRSTDR